MFGVHSIVSQKPLYAITWYCYGFCLNHFSNILSKTITSPKRFERNQQNKIWKHSTNTMSMWKCSRIAHSKFTTIAQSHFDLMRNQRNDLPFSNFHSLGSFTQKKSRYSCYNSSSQCSRAMKSSERRKATILYGYGIKKSTYRTFSLFANQKKFFCKHIDYSLAFCLCRRRNKVHHSYMFEKLMAKL